MLSALEKPEIDPTQAGRVVTEAAIRAADLLGISQAKLGRVIGVSAPSVTRLARGDTHLREGEKAYQLALQFIRLFRSLDSLVGGNTTQARDWLNSENLALEGEPITLIESPVGLIHVVDYLDAMRG